MTDLINKFDPNALKGNKEGAIVAVVIAGVTAIGALCKYALDVLKGC